MQYIAYLHKDSDSHYGVSFPDFPGCVTQGKTFAAAYRFATEALALHIAGLLGDGVTEPSTLAALSEDLAHS